MSEIPLGTDHGIKWGSAELSCLFSHKGAVTFGLKTPRRDVQIYVTRTGLVRVFDHGGREWCPRGEDNGPDQNAP